MTNDSINIPNFTGDDFADDKEIQRSRAAVRAYEKMIDGSLSVIRNLLEVRDASHKNLKDFFMFKCLQATIVKSFKSSGKNNALQVSLAEYSSAFPIPKSSNSGTDKYLFGYFLTRKEYPRTYIHKETIREKIADLFLKTEVDFEHSKKFSKKFHVLTEDRQRLLELFQFIELDALTKFPEMEIELSGNACLFRSSRKPVSIEEATIFSELAKALLSTLK